MKVRIAGIIAGVMLLGAVLFPGLTRAQSFIKLQFNGLRDSSIILGYYHGEGRYALDTAQMNARGEVVFHSDSSYLSGMYLAILPGGMGYVDFLLGKGPQKVVLEADVEDILASEKGGGQRVFEDFINFQQFMGNKTREQREVYKLDSMARAQKPEKPEESEYYKQARELAERLNKEVISYQQGVVDAHSDDILGKFTQAVMPVETPEYTPAPSVRNVDSAKWAHNFYYQTSHYLDNIDLGYGGILRLPAIVDKVNTYLDRIILQIPDTISRYCDTILRRAEANEDNFRFWTYYLMNKYQLSQQVGMDAVFVHIAQKYYLAGKTPWVSEETLGKIDERVENLLPNLLGKVAADFKVETIDHLEFQLSKDKSPATLLVFWEPGCSHCRHAIPRLDSVVQIYNKYGLKTVGFMTQGDGPAWQKYVNEHKLMNWTHVWDPYDKSGYRRNYDIYSTPVIYILDKEHKILVKRISVEAVGPIVEDILKSEGAISKKDLKKLEAKRKASEERRKREASKESKGGKES